MPKFVLPPRENLIEFIDAIDLRTKLGKTEDAATFNTKSVYLSKSFVEKLTAEQSELLAAGLEVAITKGGGFIDPVEESRVTGRCPLPNFPVHVTNMAGRAFDDFMDNVRSHPFPINLGLGPDQYEKVIHIYPGKENGGNEFNAVLVPAFANISGPGAADPIVEARSFTVQNPFFAFVISTALKGPSGNVNRCRDLVRTKDIQPVVGFTEVVSFSVDVFSEVRRRLRKTPTFFRLKFARNDQTGNLTVVLCFLEVDRVTPILSNITSPPSQGVYFDQGDLIPPPSSTQRDAIL